MRFTEPLPVALVARTSHAGFVNEFTGTIALATSNYIRHIHTPLHCADKIRTGKRPELGCVYSWKLWYFPCNIVIHNLVYAVFVYCQIVFISITFPVCRVRVLHNERKPVLSETSIIRFSHILSPFFLGWLLCNSNQSFCTHLSFTNNTIIK